MKHQRLIIRAAALGGALALFSPFIHARSGDGPVRLDLELDRPVLPTDGPVRVIVKIALDGDRPDGESERAPIDLALVLDRSGSMSGEKLAQAKAAAIEALNRLGPDDIFSLVVFDGQVNTLIPARRVGDRRGLERRIRSIRAGGSTAIFDGVNQGAEELRKFLDDGRFASRLILLSDGQANVGPSSPEDLGRLGRGLGREGISVTTIGLGFDYDEDLMTRLARESDGNTYFVKSGEQLPSIFEAELGDALDVVAHHVSVSIEFPEGIRPIRWVGREGTIDGQRAGFSLNQIYGGREKFGLIEVEVPEAAAGVERVIGQAELTYRDALTQQAKEVRCETTARFSSDRELVIRSANQRVQADYAENVIALAEDAAVELADRGEVPAAAAEMNAHNAELQALARTYRNSTVDDLVGLDLAAVRALGAQGMNNEMRKDFRAKAAATVDQESVSGSADPAQP